MGTRGHAAFGAAAAQDRARYERQRDRLREELTLAQIDYHAEAVDELDAQGILAFSERVLPRASDLWSKRRSTTSSACRSRSSRKDRVRRKSIESNRRNGATFPVLGAGSEC
jgi:hypothetical protein